MRIMPSTAPATPTAAPPGNPAAASPARRVTGWAGQAILDDPDTASVLHAAWSGDPAVIVPSPPGAGKTRLVALLAAALSDRAGLRVGVAAQTRDQAAEIARRVGALGVRGSLMLPASAATPMLPGSVTAAPARKVRFPSDGGGVLIATTALWFYRDPAQYACDVMVVDEAWQATYADLGALGAYAGQVVCVGDPGQIAPVVTGETGRWRTVATGPHLPAPDALRAAHGDAIGVVTLRHTWRLGPQTTALIQPAFYPGLPFTSRRPPEHLTSASGSVLPEISYLPITVTAGPGDPDLARACEIRVRDLLATMLTLPGESRPTVAADLAVVCAHVTQAAAVRALLADVPDVLVGTANQLQGLERHAVVVMHPLAGYRDGGAFVTDPGRACVMFSRHRAHLSLISDSATPEVLARCADDPGAAAQLDLLDRLSHGPA